MRNALQGVGDVVSCEAIENLLVDRLIGLIRAAFEDEIGNSVLNDKQRKGLVIPVSAIKPWTLAIICVPLRKASYGSKGIILNEQLLLSVLDKLYHSGICD
jgi:hypothetical protein